MGHGPANGSGQGCSIELEAAAEPAAAFPEEARRWRERQTLKTAGAGIAAQAVSYAIRLAVVPLSLKLLGTEGYGLFLAVGSLVAWGGLADLGMSAGLVNVVGSALGKGDNAGARRAISAALWVFIGSSTLVAVAAIALSRWDRLARVLGLPDGSHTQEVGALVAICGVILAGSLGLRTISSVCLAVQKGYWNSIFQVASSGCALAILGLLAWRGATLADYALAVGLPPLLCQVILAGLLFGAWRKDLRPGFERPDRQALRTLWSYAAPLTLAQLANLALVYTPNLMIANRLGPGAVPLFAVPWSLFVVFSTFIYQVTSAHLPAYCDAYGREDWKWIRNRAVQVVTHCAAIMALVSFGVLAVGEPAIRIWTRGLVSPGWTILGPLCGFAFFEVLAAANGIFLTGIGRVRARAVLRLAAAGIFVSVAWSLLPRWGVAGLAVAGGAAQCVDAAGCLAYGLWWMRDRAGGKGTQIPAAPTERRSGISYGH